jgi:hypothetical protein
VGSHFSFEKSFPEEWEVIFRLKNHFPKCGKSFFARKIISRSVGSHFSLEKPFRPTVRECEIGGLAEAPPSCFRV